MAEIRRLTQEDYDLYCGMELGAGRDYIRDVYHRLVESPGRMYGWFEEGHLAATAGWSLTADTFAMLGRLRTDVRFRGRGIAGKLMEEVRALAGQETGAHWIGGFTEIENKPARRVLEQAGLIGGPEFHIWKRQTLPEVPAEAVPWKEVHDSDEKRRWLEKMYETRHMPVECYYPFPPEKPLFRSVNTNEWHIVVHPDGKRAAAAVHDQKGNDYLHVLYPWTDADRQPGLWKALTPVKEALDARLETETIVWIDEYGDQPWVASSTQRWELDSSWILYERI
ncbi:GNAT family N-acetyltransferase [Alkalicoccus urumqiensis]|uniref:GNAT family N-acetyltransferase n=1 Tax=Alkalicoccus urumqiensis TaxID=1548213 RepID=UPI0015E5D0F9|nr:GNAT family N-acetyltransferase [Alkalicoccus urumqiensis]